MQLYNKSMHYILDELKIENFQNKKGGNVNHKFLFDSTAYARSPQS